MKDEDFENPQKIENIVKALGGRAVPPYPPLADPRPHGGTTGGGLRRRQNFFLGDMFENDEMYSRTFKPSIFAWGRNVFGNC